MKISKDPRSHLLQESYLQYSGNVLQSHGPLVEIRHLKVQMFDYMTRKRKIKNRVLPVLEPTLEVTPVVSKTERSLGPKFSLDRCARILICYLISKCFSCLCLYVEKFPLEDF